MLARHVQQDARLLLKPRFGPNANPPPYFGFEHALHPPSQCHSLSHPNCDAVCECVCARARVGMCLGM